MFTFCFFFFFESLLNVRQLPTRCSRFAVIKIDKSVLPAIIRDLLRRTFPTRILLGLALLRYDFVLFLLSFQSLICKVHLHRPVYIEHVRDKGKPVPANRTYFRRRTSSSMSVVLEA